MAIITREQYLQSIAGQKPAVYVGGLKVETLWTTRCFAPTIHNMGLGYEWANDPQFAIWSCLVTLIEEKVSF